MDALGKPTEPVSKAEFCISLEQSIVFARLSGDYNPLHIDPVVARRTPFGSTVAHGIHLFLRAVDELGSRGLLDRKAAAAVSANFHTPVLTGATVSLSVETDAGKIRLSLDVAGTPAFTGAIELRPVASAETSMDDSEFEPARPVRNEFPPDVSTGTVPVKLSKTLMTRLFPSLARLANTAWIAEVLATTQIVGMSCPGLDSIYSGFKLRRTSVSAGSPLGSMAYQVNGSDKRFRLIRMQVAGNSLCGTVEAFFRPEPVRQAGIKQISKVITPGAFIGNRVLIVGGSRGLGEVVTKIVAASGADVTFTFAHGTADAEAICGEIREFGGRCTAYQMALPFAEGQNLPDWLTRIAYTHVYYFASPPILKNSGRWNESLFQQYARIFVNAFAALVEHTLAATPPGRAPTRFFYPSSIFVTEPENGFAEYAAAKATGEALCDQLQSHLRARFTKTRLPRMRTDQTNSLSGTVGMDPLPIILKVVQEFHA